MAHHHNHDHSNGHHHHASPNHQGRVFVMTIVLNMAFVVIELAYGFIANSTALMAMRGITSPMYWACYWPGVQ